MSCNQVSGIQIPMFVILDFALATTMFIFSDINKNVNGCKCKTVRVVKVKEVTLEVFFTK